MYNLSLQTAGLAAGIFLVFLALPSLLVPRATMNLARAMPRSFPTGAVLLTIAAAWGFWLAATMELGEFSGFRKPMMILLPVGYVLTLRFVNEFLAVRALGMLLLLAGEPLLEAAFLRHEASRLLVTVLAYVLIVKGLFYVMMPYLMRDAVAAATRSTGRWVAVNALMLLYGVAVLYFAFTQY